jgi:hypothetical protein
MLLDQRDDLNYNFEDGPSICKLGTVLRMGPHLRDAIRIVVIDKRRPLTWLPIDALHAERREGTARLLVTENDDQPRGGHSTEGDVDVTQTDSVAAIIARVEVNYHKPRSPKLGRVSVRSIAVPTANDHSQGPSLQVQCGGDRLGDVGRALVLRLGGISLRRGIGQIHESTVNREVRAVSKDTSVGRGEETVPSRVQPAFKGKALSVLALSL